MSKKKKQQIPKVEPVTGSAEFGSIGWKIELPGMNEPDHAMLFAHGTGVLSIDTIAYVRPEWIKYDGKKWHNVRALPIFEPLLEYMKKKGAKITPISAQEATKLFDKILKDPDSFRPKEKKEESKETSAEVKKGGSEKAGVKTEPLPHELKKGNE